MDDYTKDAHELDWDEEISDDGGQFILLEEGDYNFTVTKFERGRFPGGDKIPACKKVTMTISVNTKEGVANTLFDLILWSTLTWKISEFFRAIGQKKHGESFRPDWNAVAGSVGRAHFKPKSYVGKDGKERHVNDITKFYDYDPAFFFDDPTPGSPTSAAFTPSAPQNSHLQQPPKTAQKWQKGKF